MNAPAQDHPTKIGDRYRLDERIGAGAMGAVWRGTDELLNRTVALKELLAAAEPHTAAGGDALEESRQRLMREGRIGARLQHPHVISMFDVVVHDDRPWLIMEYLPSQSLAAVLSASGPMKPHTAAEVGRQVADGLAAAHAAGVVHRDVKPGNVLMAEDGLVKLTDFGVSRAVDDVQLTRTGLIAGTPAFMAPEVARGQDPTAASDVFALGATLCAAVEGRPPFGLNDNAYALLHKVATGVVHPPEQAGPLTALLMRLLDNDPDARPTAAQARDALASVAAGAGRGAAADDARTAVLGAAAPSAGPTVSAQRPPARPAYPPAGYPSARPASPPPDASGRRRPVLLALLAVLLLGGAITAVVLSSNATDNPNSTPIAQSTPTAAPAVPASTPSPSRSPTSSRPSTTATTPPPAVGDPVAFLRGYYGLLPDDTDAAFALLSPRAQADSGGRKGFEDFYADMKSVTLENVRSAGGQTVDATIVFEKKGGATSREPYRFVMTTNGDGQTIMDSFSRL